MFGLLRRSSAPSAMEGLERVKQLLVATSKVTPDNSTESNASKAGRTVMIAVDGSETSHRAVQWAAEKVLAAGDTAVILHVEPSLDGEPGLSLYEEAYAPPGIMAAIKRKRREETLRLTQSMVAACQAHNVPSSVAIVEGSPRQAIVEAACRKQASLLVVGNRDLGLLHRAFLGSTSSYCVRNSPCPVLVFRDADAPSVG
eukprot:TRINITY_DN7968_c0_g1_i1.p1 TRINITY_DN7968_c0_g1~~TRINITY_DN7968_c0_g1_i1.p1  ORF type:complete len:200 (+),score=10.27 TRINITY_DN7968_c0_g1_i1:142-741(+)